MHRTIRYLALASLLLVATAAAQTDPDSMTTDQAFAEYQRLAATTDDETRPAYERNQDLIRLHRVYDRLRELAKSDERAVRRRDTVGGYLYPFGADPRLPTTATPPTEGAAITAARERASTPIPDWDATTRRGRAAERLRTARTALTGALQGWDEGQGGTAAQLIGPRARLTQAEQDYILAQEGLAWHSAEWDAELSEMVRPVFTNYREQQRALERRARSDEKSRRLLELMRETEEHYNGQLNRVADRGLGAPNANRGAGRASIGDSAIYQMGFMRMLWARLAAEQRDAELEIGVEDRELLRLLEQARDMLREAHAERRRRGLERINGALEDEGVEQPFTIGRPGSPADAERIERRLMEMIHQWIGGNPALRIEPAPMRKGPKAGPEKPRSSKQAALDALDAFLGAVKAGWHGANQTYGYGKPSYLAAQRSFQHMRPMLRRLHHVRAQLKQMKTVDPAYASYVRSVHGGWTVRYRAFQKAAAGHAKAQFQMDEALVKARELKKLSWQYAPYNQALNKKRALAKQLARIRPLLPLASPTSGTKK